MRPFRPIVAGSVMFYSKKFRGRLLVGVSVFALSTPLPEIASAADMPREAPSWVAAPEPVVTMYVEGGALITGGPQVLFYDPSMFAAGHISTRPGWDAAGGIDYQLAASPWHVSIDFLYGAARTKTLNNSFNKSFSTGTFASATSGTLHATHNESHSYADFMIGRDIGLGLGPNAQSQLQFGVRVADLQATTTVAGNFGFSVFFLHGNLSSAYTNGASFLGVGPRLATQGSVPVQGPWEIDYSAGAAVLYGERRSSFDGVFSQCFFTAGSCSSSTFSNSNIDRGWVPNANAMLALAYAVTPHLKISVGYQIDYYWNALPTGGQPGPGVNSAAVAPNLNIVNVDRYYDGPFLRVTGKF
jgi:major outer membrane protein